MKFNHSVFEIVMVIGVALPKMRLFAVNGIIVLLIAFIPSYIYFTQLGSCVESTFCIAPWIVWIRLLIVHLLLILWAWGVGKSN